MPLKQVWKKPEIIKLPLNKTYGGQATYTENLISHTAS